MNNAFIAQYFHWDDRRPRGWHRPFNKLFAKLRINAQLGPRSFTWGMANVEARMNVFHLASQTVAYNVPGDLVEVGCNSGESSIVVTEVLRSFGSDKKLHCFDSFKGLPELNGHDAADGVYGAGWMSAGRQQFNDNFRAAGIEPPVHVHEGWFEDTIPAMLPDKISFAIIDGDIYSSTKHVLPHIYERMSSGAIALFGIYYDEDVFRRDHTIPQYKSPGVKRATDEFFADKPEKVAVLYANEYSNGYFRKH